MFNKRRASTGVHMPKQYSQPPATSQSSTAATAATTAFNKKSSHGGLSSAAAAAALRSHPSPIPQLGDIQTKRSQRRGSNGSDTSRYSVATIGHTQNLTSPSRSSLIDRSLRSPSPGGRRTPLDRAPYVPPIPAIPSTLITSNASRPRAASLEPVNRTPSSASRRTNSRGASMDYSEEKLDRLKQSTLQQQPALQVVPETPSEKTKRLVNFSRPMSPHASPISKSPGQAARTASDSPQDGSGWFAGPVVHHSDMRHNVESVRDVSPSQSTHQDAPPLMSTDRGSKKLQRLLKSTTGSIKKQDPSWKPTVVRTNSLETSKWSDSNTQAAQAPANPPQDFATDQRLGPIISQGSGSNASNNRSSSPAGQQKENVTSIVLPQAPEVPRALSPLSKTQSANGPTSSRRLSDAPKPLQFDIASSEHKHQPLGRSASPAKSALKTSQNSGNRRNSLTTVAQSRFAETPAASEPTRKKSVRINLEVVPGEESSGLAASKHAPSQPVKAPATKAISSNFEDDMNGLMQPRPALPFFGSVRRNSRESVTVDSVTTGEPVSNQGLPSASQHSIPQQGSLLKGKGTRRDDSDSAKTAPRDTKDEDDDDLLSSDDEETDPQLPSPSEKFMAASEALREAHRQPVSANGATAKEQISKPVIKQQDSYSVPGSFPEADERKSEPETARAQAPSQELAKSPVQSSVPAIVVIPTTPPVTDTPSAPEIDSDDGLQSSDDDSVYEDAAEELENYEFASLDQILEEPSPELDDSEEDYVTSKKKAPLLRQESGDTLALERRLEEARLNSTGQAQKIAAIPPPESASVQKVHSVNDHRVSRSPAPPAQARTVTELPTSLRSSKWSPANAPRQSIESQKRAAQVSPTPGPASPARGRLNKQASAAQKPVVVRQRSADSVSSFRKSKPPSRADGGYSLRQSMRSSSTSRLPDTRGRTQRRPMTPDDASTYSLRTSMRSGMSPSSTTSRTKTSWKDRLTSPSRLGNKLRPAKEKKEKQSKPRFGRRFSNASVAESTSSINRNGFVSRFAEDSDDEEFTPPRRNQAPLISLTPVRGIPRARGEADGDSTDLDDSDDDRAPPPIPSTNDVDKATTPASATSKPTDTATGTQGLASSKFAPVRPGANKRWSSFLGVGNRKHKLTQQANMSTPTLINPPLEDSPSKFKSSKLRRKTQRQTSQPLGAPVGWPLKDTAAANDSSTTAGKSLELASPNREKDTGFDFTNHGEHSPAALNGDFEKHETDAASPQRNGVGHEGVDLSAEAKARKEEKGRFGKFKRMFSKKQKHPSSPAQVSVI